MPTLFSRLSHYQLSNKKHPLNNDQKKQLGEKICQHYRSQNKVNLPVSRVLQIEPEGTFAVLSYPHQYKLEIDRQIDEFYKALPPPHEPKKRKRIPTKIVKEASVKPSGQISGQL